MVSAHMKINWINEDFYKPEYRDGFFVSSERKKLWAVELDLLKQFIKVCSKNNLKYFLNGGTLLGAVRHGGFIPWDDDIDVMMPREDFEKLLKISQKEFNFPYFFQTPLSEKNFFRAHAQLRNSLTTGCTLEDKDKDINRGVFIDIFILDAIPSNVILRLFFKYEVIFLRKALVLSLCKKKEDLSPSQCLLKRLIDLFFTYFPHKRYYEFLQAVMSKYSSHETEYVAEIGLGFKRQGIWKRSWFKNDLCLPFEMLKLRVPSEYAKVLSVQYGPDYMKIPDEKGRPQNLHGSLIFSADVPFDKFFKN